MSWTDQYSTLDRFVHDVAFAGTGLQKVVADIEDHVFAAQFADLATDRPVFITSLPRAGTTLMLELFASLPEFASHTYRNMPFLLCPMFWNQLSQGFQKQMVARERAHKDGVMIDFDSAEAFEEALWQAWWPEKYRDGRIVLWDGAEDNEEFRQFFDNHLKKIISLGRQRKSDRAMHYVSKNNNNIARLPALVRLYPDCRIVIPVREPLSHVRSLHRQHMRFLTAHDEDAFSRRYMNAIGHLEFGANLKPIRFPGFDLEPDAAVDASFWLEYWIAAFAMLAKLELEQIRFVNFDELCQEPQPTLHELLAWLEIETAAAARLAEKVTNPSSKNLLSEDLTLDAARVGTAEEIYRRLVL